MTIAAIETRYAGCRFRSRLEARWAVFFDRLGIAWEYELQGYSVSRRLTLGDDRFPYLPDFWLPVDKMHVEVKGSLTEAETVRLLDAAASLSSNDGGGCHDSGGHDVIVCGRLGRFCGIPLRLHMHKGDLMAAPWHPTVDLPGDECRGANGFILASDYGDDAIFEASPSLVSQAAGAAEVLLLGAHPAALGDQRTIVHEALIAARSARFEHGENG